MGCDIHTRVEVEHPDNGWVMAGEIFDREFDSKDEVASEEIFATLSDGQFMEGVRHAFLRLEKEENTGRYLTSKDMRFVEDLEKTRILSESSVRLLAEFRKLHDQLYARMRDETDRIKEEGWDYIGKVLPMQRRLRREFYDRVLIPKSVRNEIENAVLRFRYEDGSPYELHLHRVEGDPPFKTAEPTIDRNYLLFAVLANVRNSFGFAGLDAGDPIAFIDDPRGLPEDCSLEWKELVDQWGVDGHSHSYFTVAEIQDWDGWDQITVNRAVTSASEYEEYMLTGKQPSSTCLEISGRNVVTVPWWDYDEHMRNRDLYGRTMGEAFRGITEPTTLTEDRPGTLSSQPLYTKPIWDDDEVNVHVKFQWMQKLSEQLSGSFFEVLEEIKNLGDGSGEDVRLMMFFDN